jgi:hypothetical protein
MGGNPHYLFKSELKPVLFGGRITIGETEGHFGCIEAAPQMFRLKPVIGFERCPVCDVPALLNDLVVFPTARQTLATS